MRHLDTTLSDTITFYALQFEDCAHTGCSLSAGETDRLVQQLKKMRKLARNLEQEVAVHRMTEAHHTHGAALEKEASVKLQQLVTDPDGKIVRPDFRGGRKS
ncbi:hypothetical protein [Martelella mediterranea]|uniref:Uncharacterized protein n=1 Tax=Martelella mediterranea TaxID=293089 RepID=A0A4R3NSP8_9HYPH|nr:hypothetical protein [Martelella mediterranea]TCT39601.1 hypothetical protein EDC90_101299 [Martelella mediterranea]